MSDQAVEMLPSDTTVCPKCGAPLNYDGTLLGVDLTPACEDTTVNLMRCAPCALYFMRRLEG